MFRKSILKLTIGYVAGIMVLSSIFSVALYRASTAEIDRFERQQLHAFQRGIPIDFPILGDDFLQERLRQVRDARRHIFIWLLEFNAVVLVIGGGVGYLLARYTIRPIQRAWESQARFTADASHELRTPLTTMRTENDVALRDPKLTLSEAKTILQSNVEEVTKLTGLSNALLKLNQLQGRSVTLQPVAVTTVVSKAVERLAKPAGLRQMNITTHIDAQTIMADPDLLTEALVVLIDNAIKYGQENTAITVDARRYHHHVHISVTNHGDGVSEADQPKIFERFYRGDSSRTKSTVEGFGLGLSLANDIVNAHGGTITLTSIPKDVTTFTISLPIDQAPVWKSMNPFHN